MIHHRLPNGVTIIVDPDPRFASVNLAICLIGGLSDESEEMVGVSHLLEHLLFKQTRTKRSRELAAAMDELGGEINAFTDYDSLCVYGSSPNRQFAELSALLGEIILDHRFEAEDVRVEREIIRQEILETVDSPSDATYQCVNRILWPNSIYRFPVFGSIDSLQRIGIPELTARRNALLTGSRCLIACCGGVDADAVIRFAESSFGELPAGEPYSAPPPVRAGGIEFEAQNASQVYVVITQPWIPGNSDDVAAGLVVSTVLGGGLSSRLFQKLREEAGLAYEVGASVEMVSSESNLIVSCVVERANLEQAVGIILQEMENAARSDITEEEAERAKKLLRARFDLDLDSPANRLWYAVDHEIRSRSFIDLTHPEAVMAKLEQLSLDQIHTIASSWLLTRPGTVVFGGNVKGCSKTSFARDNLDKILLCTANGSR